MGGAVPVRRSRDGTHTKCLVMAGRDEREAAMSPDARGPQKLEGASARPAGEPHSRRFREGADESLQAEATSPV